MSIRLLSLYLKLALSYLQVCPFFSRVTTPELTFTKEGKLISFGATFEVKTSWLFTLIDVSGNTLSATLLSVSLSEVLTSKRFDWSTAEFHVTSWVWELELLAFKGSDWSIAEYDDRDWISEPESFIFNGNSI